MNYEYYPRKDSIEIIRQSSEALIRDIDAIIQQQKVHGYCKEELFLAQETEEGVENARSYGRWTVYVQDEYGAVFKLMSQSGVHGLEYSIVNGNINEPKSFLSFIKVKANVQAGSHPGLLLESSNVNAAPHLEQDALLIQEVNDAINSCSIMSEEQVKSYREYLQARVVKLFKPKKNFLHRLLGDNNEFKW